MSNDIMNVDAVGKKFYCESQNAPWNWIIDTGDDYIEATQEEFDEYYYNRGPYGEIA